MLPEVRRERPSIDLPRSHNNGSIRTYVRKLVVWCPTNAHRNGARTGTGWDRTGWSWDGTRAPARRRCAPREPPDTAPTCASPAMRRFSFHPIRGHRSPGCSGHRDRRGSSHGPVREASEPAASQTQQPTLIQKIVLLKLRFELGKRRGPVCRVDRRQHHHQAWRSGEGQRTRQVRVHRQRHR